MRSRLASEELALRRCREESHTLEARAARASGDLDRLRGEHREAQQQQQDQLQAERKRAAAEKRAIERQLSSQTQKLRQEELKATDLVRAQESLRHRLQEEASHEKENLQNQIQRLQTEHRQFKDKTRRELKAMMTRRLEEESLMDPIGLE